MYVYDQGSVLAGTITGFARRIGAASLLDIGAGGGAVACELARSVDTYLAVEQDGARARALSRLGVPVIEGTFPLAVEGRFGLVVSSHSLPEEGGAAYPPFLEAAWALVAPGGSLLITTFKGIEDSPVMRLAAAVRGRPFRPDSRYALVRDWIARQGRWGEDIVTSHVETDDYGRIEEFFGHWFWRDEAERRERRAPVRRLVDAEFLRNGRYRMPTPHNVIWATKSAQAGIS